MELHQALMQIAEIRARVAATEQFRGYRALPVAITGLLALLGATLQPWFVPDPVSDLGAFLALWLSVAVLGAVVAGSGAWIRNRYHPDPVSREVTHLAISQFLPCLVAGALCTLAISRHAPEVGWLLPGFWQVLFSLGIFASCRLLPRAIVGVAVFYLLSGCWNLANLSNVSHFSPWAMGIPFGVGQLTSAAILYWNLERDHGRID